MNSISLKYIRNTRFKELYNLYLCNPLVKGDDLFKLLQMAILFINYGDVYLQRLGYRIVVQYSNQYNDYQPLYDVAINKGFIPIVKYIESKTNNSELFENKFFNLYASSYNELYKYGDIYLTEQQLEMHEDFIDNLDKTSAIIAPTSYGKSELINEAIKYLINCNICIIVPTKALLSQAKRRIINAVISPGKIKIITHPEMYKDNDKNIIAVLTQERLLRLLKKINTMCFDYVFIDEAHNILDSDPRNKLLATTIAILYKRNKNTTFKFLTPFLLDSSNLLVAHTKYEIVDYRVTEHIKNEKYYCYDFRSEGCLKIYDQYTNTMNETDIEYDDDIALINSRKGNKNIVYLNKPPNIEEVAIRLLEKREKINSARIRAACNDIKSFIHGEYTLVKCLEHGVVYHHGSVPDNVRLFIEKLYSSEKELEYIVTSSTLLEGVNIPADKLFVLDYMKGNNKLTPSQFMNLVGRVCRFKEIFAKGSSNIKMLEPEIYVIASNYLRRNANIRKFFDDCVKIDNSIKEKPANVLLKNTDIKNTKQQIEQQKAEEYLENTEPGIITTYVNRVAETDIGKRCFANGLTELKILEYEEAIQRKIKTITDTMGKAKTPEDIINYIAEIFIHYINIEDDYNKLMRLKEQKTRAFYRMFLDWRLQGVPYSLMINSFLRYWQRITDANEDTLIYVGKWGDRKRDNARKKLWVDIKEKTINERINLAIVKIKDEQDFIDNELIKFIEVLNDTDLIDKDLYNGIKYGTTDIDQITMIKNGISFSLAKLLVEKYSSYIDIDNNANTVFISNAVLGKMHENGENGILIFEAEYNVKTNS